MENGQEPIVNDVTNDETSAGAVATGAKRRRIVLCLLAGAVLLCVIAVLGIVFELKGRSLSQPVTVEVREGASTTAIAGELKEKGVIGSSLTFRLYCRLTHADGTFRYGNYAFEGQTSYAVICRRLASEGAAAASVRVVIPEGTGINDYSKDVNGTAVTVPGIATLLERAGVCTKADFLAAMQAMEQAGTLPEGAAGHNTYYTLEGYLYPDTYDFFTGDSAECARAALEKMVQKGREMLTDELVNAASEHGLDRHELLTLASVVQMEAGSSTSEMKQVAAVFYNRLADGGSLGSSPTCYYDRSFPDGDGRYDTYRIVGLPVGPLCSPGIDAIRAVAHPMEGCADRYFVSDVDGRFYFTDDYAQQLQTIEELKKNGKWIYEYLD